MKRLLPLLLILVLLAGCQGLYPDEYVSLQEHVAPFAYRETEAPTTEPTQVTEPVLPTASRAYDIREAIQDLVIHGEETGRILLQDYEGDVETDMKNMFSALLRDSPKYTYAMDRFDWSLDRAPEGEVVTVSMKLRLTPQEVQAISTRLWPNAALNEMYRALIQQLSSVTLQVSGYQETDLVALLEDYILHHPDQIVEAPGISAAVYPDKGNLRVVEVHFVYHSDRETLRTRREATVAFLSFVTNQIARIDQPQALVEALYKHLVPGLGYGEAEDATVYSQVVEKLGSSKTMASVVEYFCSRAGFTCEIVQGTRGESPWYWNRVLSDEGWLYFDLHAAALAGHAPDLLPAGAMTDYAWDPARYPEAEPQVPEETELPAPEPQVPEQTELPAPETAAPEETELPAPETAAPEETELPAPETAAPEETELPAPETAAPEEPMP